MEIINLNNNEYVEADYILSKALVYSKGVRTGKELIKKYNIDNTNYIFGRKNKDNQWIQTEGKSLKFDKVLFLLNFVNTINEMKEEDASMAPPIIKLKDEEKFYDDEGNFINIEVRGIKEVDKIYFKVKDVAKGFNLNKLQDTLIENGSRYNEKHYKYFNCKIFNKNKKEKIKKTLFLTYIGLLRVLFTCKNPRIKELNIVNNIKNYYKNLKWICNKELKPSKYRPDMLCNLDDLSIIIEIDENQHKYYRKYKEETRINTLNNIINNNIIYIRINPDFYKDNKNKNHTGIDKNKNEFNIRMNIIINEINNIINNKPKENKNIKLFYNNFNFNEKNYINNIINFNYENTDNTNFYNNIIIKLLNLIK
jgi:hypothetical protein